MYFPSHMLTAQQEHAFKGLDHIYCYILSILKNHTMISYMERSNFRDIHLLKMLKNMNKFSTFPWRFYFLKGNFVTTQLTGEREATQNPGDKKGKVVYCNLE